MATDDPSRKPKSRALLYADLQERYMTAQQKFKEEQEKETLLWQKLKPHLEAQEQRMQSVRTGSGRGNVERGVLSHVAIGASALDVAGTGVDPHGATTKDHSLVDLAWPQQLLSSTDFSLASVAALTAYVDQMEAQVQVQTRANAQYDHTWRPLDFLDVCEELERSVVVTFLGSSSVELPIHRDTTFGDILHEAVRYFSLPPTGALLFDLQNCAWPLEKRVLDFYAADLTPPFVRLVQRLRAIMPFDTADIIEDSGGGEVLREQDGESETLLRPTDSSKQRKGVTCDPILGCAYSLVFFQLLQMALFIALALMFNPVSRIAKVHSVIDKVLFSESAFAASTATGGLVDTFDMITGESDFWAWMAGPMYDHVVSSLVTNYSDLCVAPTPFYNGNDADGHYCTSLAGTNSTKVCDGTSSDTTVCQIMRGLQTCATLNSLDMCASSLGAFAVNGYNILMGPVQIAQFRVCGCCVPAKAHTFVDCRFVNLAS